MKKKFYFATLVITALSFTGCANDEYVGDQQKLGEQNGAIAFSTKSTNTVRATSEVPTAAEKLQKTFWVYGTKKVGEENKPVFNNYRVYYTGNTNDPYSPQGWEYVGQQVAPALPQTIKYWDYSASQYDFEAYSYSTGSVKKITENAEATNGLNLNDYVVTNMSGDDYDNLYFAKKNIVDKPTDGQYSVVKLDFQSVLSKIRVGFYETIPGYSVKINRFYGPNSTDAPNGFEYGVSQVTNNFIAWCPNKKIEDEMSFVVRYGTAHNDPPTVTKVADAANSAYIEITNNESYKLDPKLTLGDNFFTPTGEGYEGKKIGETYSEVTWDNNTSKYTYVIPQNQSALCNPYGGAQAQVQPMKIKVDYTLTSTDGSGEVINVTGATAIVPVEYVQWKPNTAYSYVFKISDQTNGNTGETSDPAGLYPIIFDAVVTEMEKNDYLTTVSDLSITATQGKQFAEADKAVFKTGEAINVKVMYNSNDITSNFGSQTGSNKFEVAFVTTNNDYNYNLSPEHNLPNGTSLGPINQNSPVITLDGKDNPGFWIVKVTYKAGNETIIKYAVLKVETVPTPPSQESGQGQ